MSADDSVVPAPAESQGGWLRRVLLWVIVVVVTIAIARLIGRIEWAAVWQAMGRLTWWQPFVLLAMLAVRQVANAAPLAFYIPGVSLYRATVNDLGASTMSAFAPPPSDMALRVAMFTSWKVEPTRAVAGTVMNALTFFIVRFAAPLLGFAAVFAGGRSLGLRWLDLISLAVAAVLLAGVLLLVRTDSWAAWWGRTAGRMVRRVRSSVDPEAWARACVQFRGAIAARFGYGFPRSLAVLVLMLAADMMILFCALRFVGVGGDQLSVLDVAIAFLFAYPLTAFAMSGLGLVDMVALASLVEAGGDAVQEPALAALIIWRVFTVAGPLISGLGAVWLWRRSTRADRRGSVAKPGN
ncbi:hypothetical protein [Ruania zhangjianzhongii]|uniref:hypothetical protein n=1 Tax=Ruania zhangjianzhongii TaxID=2603206 RepID=UPI0011CAB9C7|nr:hypothetical protein [Ruania zhangjianzhongii]